MGISVTERIRLVFVRPKIRSLPVPKINSGAELEEYARRNNDYETAQRTEPLVLAYKMLAELANSGRVARAAVRQYWPWGDDPDWPESGPKWPDGWCYGALLALEVDGAFGVGSWFIERGSYLCANRLTYEELEKTGRDVTDKFDSMAEMAKRLCCVVEHSESVECEDYCMPVWVMPDGSLIKDAEDFKSAVEDNIAQAMLKRAALGLD